MGLTLLLRLKLWPWWSARRQSRDPSRFRRASPGTLAETIQREKLFSHWGYCAIKTEAGAAGVHMVMWESLLENSQQRKMGRRMERERKRPDGNI